MIIDPSNFVWYPIPYEYMGETELLHEIYILLFIWFMFWGLLKLVSYLVNSHRKAIR
jgi:hypothetical protein